MNPFGNKNSIALFFIPGIIVLIFGMLALHFTVSLIHSRSVFQGKHSEYVSALTTFHRDYYDFSKKFKNESVYKLSDVKNDLSLINDRYAQLHKMNLAEGHDSEGENSDREHILYLIGRGLQDIADNVNLYEQKKGTDEEPEIRNDLNTHIDETLQVIMFLQTSILQEYQNVISSENITQSERWLYWSVIIMGLSGFILVLINGQKLYDLKMAEQERHRVYDTMHKRLAAMEMANDGIIIVEKDESITFFNTSLARILGIPENEREAYFGKNWRSIFPENDCVKISDLIMPALRDKWHWMGDFEISLEDGKVVHTEMSSTLLPDGGMIGTVQDTSARHQAELEKKEIEDQFYQAQKMEAIGRLAGGIAHDFNNILAAMNGYAEFLMEDLKEGSDQKKFAHNILLAGKQAKDLVDQVLTFSRKTDSIQNVVDAVPILNEVQTMIEATMPKMIGLTTKVSVPSVPIFANATQISQVLMNLCVNAIDAMEEEHGDLLLSIQMINSSEIDLNNIYKEDLPDPKEIAPVRIHDEDPLRTILILGNVKEGIDYVKISVGDTGTGMSRTVMEHVFEPFYTTKSVDEGTGLGLSTVHGVIVSHRGMLVINSKIGTGTNFDIYFPVYIEENVEKERSANDDEYGEDDDLINPSENGNATKRILLVEDQDFVMDMVVRMLSRMGYELHTASNGLDGLDIIRENPGEFDLVITDYNMPKMTGLEMAQQIYLDFPELPIILLSGYSEEKIRKMLHEHPSIKVALRKPVSKEVFEREIESVLSDKVKAA